MSKTLQYGLYELCRMRIEQDEEFRAQSARGDLSVVDDELFDECCRYGIIGFCNPAFFEECC